MFLFFYLTLQIQSVPYENGIRFFTHFVPFYNFFSIIYHSTILSHILPFLDIQSFAILYHFLLYYTGCPIYLLVYIFAGKNVMCLSVSRKVVLNTRFVVGSFKGYGLITFSNREGYNAMLWKTKVSKIEI